MREVPVSVRGIIADNAANVQGALAKVSEELGLAKLTLETSIFGTLQKQCLSQRCLKKLARLRIPSQTPTLKENYPPPRNKQHPLCNPYSCLVSSRWGSRVRMLEIVVCNQVCVEHALLILRWVSTLLTRI